MSSFYNDDCIYTPDVVIFKNDESYNILPKMYWKKVDIISCAAPNLRSLSKEARKELSESDLMKMYVNRFRRIFSVAQLNGVDTLVVVYFVIILS